MKEVIDKPIDEIKIKIHNLEEIKKFNKLNLKSGQTKVLIDVEIDKKTLSFQLNKNRKVDHKMLNLLRNEENIEIILRKPSFFLGLRFLNEISLSAFVNKVLSF